MNRQWMGGLLVGGALAGAIVGWLRPIPGRDDATGDAAWEWRPIPAEIIVRSTAALFAQAQQLRWQGDRLIEDGEAEAQKVEWTLRGVLLPEAEILVQTGTNPLIERFATGDILPDGSKVAAVERDAVMLDRDGCRYRRPLYASTPAGMPADAECDQAPAPPEDQLQQ